MEEPNIDTVQNLDDDWDMLPFNKNWKETFDTISNYINKNYSKNIAEEYLNSINNLVEILIRYGNTQEDIVLKTAMIYSFLKLTKIDINIIKECFSEPILDGIKILINDSNKTLKNNLDEIFLNENLAYINKIKLAEYINEIKNIKTLKLSLQAKLIAEIDYVIELYKMNSNQKLMKLLIETRNKI